MMMDEPARKVPEIRREIMRKKVDTLLPEIMERLGIDLWLTFTREGALDPIGSDIGTSGVVGRTAALFSRAGGRWRKVCIAASYDTTPIEAAGIYDEVIPYRKEGVGTHLKDVYDELSPSKVAVNFSRDMPNCDGLTLGNYRYLQEWLDPGFSEAVTSAEELIVSFRGRKIREEVEIIEKAVILTQRILGEALTRDVIKPGETRESDVGDFIESKVKEAGYKVSFCMIMVGPDRGHSFPTERVIQPGDLLRTDFGIVIDDYHSDIQRTAYILKDGETGPPETIRRMWDVTYRANRAAMAALKPGNRARDVDAAARSLIVSEGFEEYPHAAGHEIGLSVHDVGPIIGPPWKERYGTAVEHLIEPGQVFAVEPMIYVDVPEVGGVVQIGLEEDVVVGEDGPRILGAPLESLILL
jgi:Xaa-Pro aminopeptidase